MRVAHVLMQDRLRKSVIPSQRHSVTVFRLNGGVDTIGQRIRRERKELGIDVPTLAKYAGLKPSTIYDLENGNQNSSTKLHLIAERLNVSAKWLETGKGDKHAKASSSKPAVSSAVAWGFDLTEEAAELGWQWSLLPDDQRQALHTIIYSLVTKSKNRQRLKEHAPNAPRTPDVPRGVHEEILPYKAT